MCYREPLLSSSENGTSPKEPSHADDREKDGALEGIEFEERGLEKPEKDSERILAELLALHKPQAAGGEGGLAAAALERVSALKRLLVGGSPLPEDEGRGSPEDGWRRAPENRGAGDKDEERDAGDGAESEGGAPGGAPNGPGSLDWGSRRRDGEGPGSSLVLTPRQLEDVRLSCQHLQEAVLRLKDMEEDYSQLQQLLAKYSSPPRPASHEGQPRHRALATEEEAGGLCPPRWGCPAGGCWAGAWGGGDGCWGGSGTSVL
ncbi:hypothetical protein KIL84_008153 [Mauremys mutica]|uniref:Uncharacterized protein n=1 Tax=Mauremys mutica TaxID=74926 RepID=A0A9D3XX73_9SAUR|nr:hypothetical protein KIL84_008153 [Mauremys mutica]